MLRQEDRPVPALPKGSSRRAEDRVGVRAEPTQAGLLGQIGLPKTSVRPNCEPGRTATVRQTGLTGRGAGLGGTGAERGPGATAAGLSTWRGAQRISVAPEVLPQICPDGGSWRLMMGPHDDPLGSLVCLS